MDNDWGLRRETAGGRGKWIYIWTFWAKGTAKFWGVTFVSIWQELKSTERCAEQRKSWQRHNLWGPRHGLPAHVERCNHNPSNLHNHCFMYITCNHIKKDCSYCRTARTSVQAVGTIEKYSEHVNNSPKLWQLGYRSLDMSIQVASTP